MVHTVPYNYNQSDPRTWSSRLVSIVWGCIVLIMVNLYIASSATQAGRGVIGHVAVDAPMHSHQASMPQVRALSHGLLCGLLQLTVDALNTKIEGVRDLLGKKVIVANEYYDMLLRAGVQAESRPW
jgi:hypothetical protein